MRKLSLLAVAGLLALPLTSEAKTLDELLAEKGVVAGSHGGSNAYYKRGTRLEFDNGFTVKFNVQLQARLSHVDTDVKGRADAGVATTAVDTTGFSVRRARFIVSGTALNKEFSYKLQNDFASDGGGGELKDAWIAWHASDAATIKMGQFKVPFSRQELASSANLQFTDRSAQSDYFAPSRANGASLSGDMDGLGYTFHVYNGDTDGEGANAGPADNRLAGAAQVTYNLGDYGSRGYEGDHRGSDEFGATMGAAVIYGQGSTAAMGDFDDILINVDAGMRSGGFSAQGEVYWSSRDYDDVAGNAGEREDLGWYVQGGYMFDDMELALRYGMITYDDDVDTRDKLTTYEAVFNYYLNGHDLKLQNGVRFTEEELVSGNDYTDFAYILQLAGYF